MNPIKLNRCINRHGEVSYHTTDHWVKFAQSLGNVITDKADGYFVPPELLDWVEEVAGILSEMQADGSKFPTRELLAKLAKILPEGE